MDFTIPIVINNYNRLSTTRKLYKDLVKLGYENIIILDNQSTYPPLLDWYRSLQGRNHVQVIFLTQNYGHKALWISGFINNLKIFPYIVYTDSDLELNPSTPRNFIDSLISLSKEYKADKVGLAIKIDDLPSNFMGNIIRGTESIYWVKEVPHRRFKIYQGMIDTTFALFDPNVPFNYKALRVAGDFTCKHIPWYTDFSNITKEEEYFIKNCDRTVSTYAEHYYRWKENPSS